MPLPQSGVVHASVQPSALLPFAPSSHCSVTGPSMSRKLSPQRFTLHVLRQSSVLPGVAPSSHSSPALGLTLPSPHELDVQSRLQAMGPLPAPLAVGSHCSFESLRPLPH